MNKFLKEFKDRGFFYQCTSEEDLSKLLDSKKISGYIGFDCTAESLHVGSLLQIMCLRLLQKHGHRPIVLLGGGTTRIGDPSGKDKTRKILNEKEIDKNIKNIETTSFENLKKLEDLGNFNENAYENSEKKIKFFNLGPDNNWQKNLDKQIKKEIEEKFSKEMRELNYLKN